MVIEVVDIWTGRHANALRQALRLTNEGFAAELGTAVRTVAKWNADPDLVPVTELQRALDTVLSRASADARARFTSLVGQSVAEASSRPEAPGIPESTNPFAAAAALKVDHDPNVGDLLDWLNEHAGWPDGEAESRVRRYVDNFDIRRLRSRSRKRGKVSRQAVAQALASYYRDDHARTSPYTFSVDGRSILTSVLTCPDWLDLALALGQGQDHMALAPDPESEALKLDEQAADAAAARIAEALATDTRIMNRPLYRLRQISVSRNGFAGLVSLVDFVSYALTLDLLERETLDAIADGKANLTEALPLRNRYLPSVEAVTSLSDRLCVGGPLALFAAARPGSRSRHGEADYVLLVQQRSSRVVNAAGRLAVIPKAFHEPLIDFSDDAQITATLERELEEELFGRPDLDTNEAGARYADPLHLSRLSEPMRWLIDHNDGTHWRMECTGFGLNLISGNFEFASLIVVEDEEWWTRYGGHVEANWESEGLRRYSSLDRDALAHLMHDDAWSNEGLFAFAQGLRRLSQTGGDRVMLPQMTLEM